MHLLDMQTTAAVRHEIDVKWCTQAGVCLEAKTHMGHAGWYPEVH